MNLEKVIESLEKLKDVCYPITTKEEALAILTEMRDNKDFYEFVKELGEAKKQYIAEMKEWMEKNDKEQSNHRRN